MRRTNRNLQALRILRRTLGAAANASVASMVTAAANQYGVDPALALAVANQESGLNPSLVNAQSGAAGIMQLMPATSAQFGVTNPLDPTQNIPAGVQYLSQLLNRYNGDVAEAVAAYDWGPSNVDAAIAAYGDDWLAYAPTETQNYVASVAGVTPSPSSTTTAPLTIDAETGLPVDDSTPTESLVSINSVLPSGGLDLSTVALLAILGAGAYFVARDIL